MCIPGHLTHPDIVVLNFYDLSGWGHGYMDGYHIHFDVECYI